MFQFVKKLFNKDGQLVDYYIDMMAEKNRLSQLAYVSICKKIV
nr:MAG TPA: hypothetical protein [Caudoviricetes sp.]